MRKRKRKKGKKEKRDKKGEREKRRERKKRKKREKTGKEKKRQRDKKMRERKRREKKRKKRKRCAHMSLHNWLWLRPAGSGTVSREGRSNTQVAVTRAGLHRPPQWSWSRSPGAGLGRRAWPALGQTDIPFHPGWDSTGTLSAGARQSGKIQVAWGEAGMAEGAMGRPA